jgi:hypothetical protein
VDVKHSEREADYSHLPSLRMTSNAPPPPPFMLRLAWSLCRMPMLRQALWKLKRTNRQDVALGLEHSPREHQL